MQWFLSGEGASDLGIGSPDGFKPGPMGLLLAKMAASMGGQLNFEIQATFEYVGKAQLGEEAKGMRPVKKSVQLPGAKREKETGYFFTNARALARIAGRHQAVHSDTVIAVLFRDADGTASAGRGHWHDKYNSMLDGFAEEHLTTGVAMLPNPKSEAWLLYALKSAPYQNCAALEDRSGNDNSPNSLKGELVQIAVVPDGDVIKWACEQIGSGEVDPAQIDMPSFNKFRERLHEVLDARH